MKLESGLKSVFKSKPEIFATVGLIMIFIFFPILNIVNYNLYYYFTCVILLYLFVFFSFLVYNFNELFFYRVYPFRPSFLWKKKKFNYSNIYIVEIIKLSYPHSPGVVFHFSKKTLKKTFFRNRSYAFGYRKVKELTPLIELLVEKKVNFIIKTSRGKDRIFFKRIIEATKERTSSSTKVKYVKYE